MEILIDNPLATMPGPVFLVFFGFIIFFAVIILALVRARFDASDRLSVPAVPINPDPYEIAYLRGGINEVVRSLIFSLVQKGYLEIDNTAAKFYVKRTITPPSSAKLPEIERVAFERIGEAQQPSELFSPYGLIATLENYRTRYQNRLEQQQLLTGENSRKNIKQVKWAIYFLILGIGGYKLLAALANENFNIVFLLIFMVVGVLITRAVSKLPRLTKLGKQYLERLQAVFDNMKYTSQRAYIPTSQPRVVPEATFGGVDPLLLSVGVFGSGILVGTVFDQYNQAFQRGHLNSGAGGSSGGGCGSAGCGSSCSSGSGSSCSSGSSCGGGCGGCGGGCS